MLILFLEPPFKKNADDLHEVLSKIGFEVKIFPNLTEREARDVSLINFLNTLIK